MKVSICLSGHFRSFEESFDNIKKNIIDPINKEFETNIFFSTWNQSVNSDFLKNKNINFEIEEYFTFNMNSRNFLKYQGLCCHSTCDNATSMWYKVKKSFDMINIETDLIVRLRPDVIYENIIDIELLKMSYSDNKLYMPKSHNRFLEVTRGMMDQFCFGNLNVMSKYMNTYENIKNYIEIENIPHTAESFLYENIKKIDLERIDFKYSILRENGKIDSIYL